MSTTSHQPLLNALPSPSFRKEGARGRSLTLRRAKALRQRQTPTEKIMWQMLRAKRFHGYKFKRQVPIGPFIVDFLCPQHRLILEIDGNHHWIAGIKEYDQRRTEYLQARGYRILRLGNKEVRRSLDTVLEKVRRALVCPTP